MTEPAQRPGETGGNQSQWLALVVFWIGILLYSPLREWAIDRFTIDPAINDAYAIGGGDPELAPKGLLALLPDHPRNPKLLWALGDLYQRQERPVLAALYFQAVYSTQRRTGLAPLQLDVLDDWLPENSPADREVGVQIESLQEAFRQYEDDYHVGVVAYPESINGVLNRPAIQHPAEAGYLPPTYAVPCGPDRPRCGSDFNFSSGRLWQALAEQKLTIADTRGGSDCCVLHLDDPDLRSLDRIMEDAFIRDPERMDIVYSTTTQAGRRARLALMSRVLAKQNYVLDFARNSDAGFSDERPWTIWSWLRLIGWLIFALLLNALVHEGIARLRARPAASPS